MHPTNTEKSSSSSIPSDEKEEWIDLLNESVHTSEDIDIGDIYAVSRNFVVVMRGLINVHYYYIPISKVEGWDDNVLWLNISENQVNEKYERNKIPDPRRYFVKDYPYYNIYLRSLSLIPSKKRSTYYYDILPKRNSKMSFKCDLCKEIFLSEDQLDQHMKLNIH
ncbi:MAG TPA: hypothetical protein VLA74_07640 [Nitrososphaeraceae archaeon]|nr:hypothetical protein [Nitrososphaeraceae archaeon]